MMENRVKNLSIIGLMAALSLGGYLLTSHFVFRVGFPLDDSWIHQTYARNLALRSEWSFLPGQPSAGSTAPFWSALLALGYFFDAPYFWTLLLGYVILVLVTFQGRSIFQKLYPSGSKFAIWAGLFLTFEWHLVWAAASGMETLLIALLILAIFNKLLDEQTNWFLVGVLVGVSVWVRPDGLTLLGPALMSIFFRQQDWRERLQNLGNFVLGSLLFVVLYLLFNRILAGAWWPNTFFAKQAEYALDHQQPLWQRYAAQLSLPMVGAGAIMLPGFILLSINALRKRKWVVLAGLIWLWGYLFIYALRLPVTYQHGRYVIPGMPVYFIYSLAGFSGWVRLRSKVLWRRTTSQVWLISAVTVLVIFWARGAHAYAMDVAVIESEMVEIAHWIFENTPPDSVVAAHDIGALGYYANRDLVDLAGLISPEVIPIIRDEQRLEQFLNHKQAEYLVTFPSLYPYLTSKANLVFQNEGQYSPLLGGENMGVYQWTTR